MNIAIIVLILLVVSGFGYLLWRSRDSWRWFHLTAASISMILAITFLFPTAGVLKSRAAWNRVKEDLENKLERLEKEQESLKFGNPLDPAEGEGLVDLQLRLQKFATEAGRRWANLRMQGTADGSVTLVRPAARSEQPPGIEPDAVPVQVNGGPLIPVGLVVYGFGETPQPGVAVPVPTFFLGEFKVTASTPTQVTILPTFTLEARQQQAIGSGQAQSWSLYELLPLDGHEPFVALGSEPTDDAAFGRVDDEAVRRLLGQGVSEGLRSAYLRDGSRVRPDDPPTTRWTKIEFTKPHGIVVDSPEKRNVLDGGFFDVSGQSVDSRLQRGEDGTVRFRTSEQIVLKEEAANELIELGVAKLVDTYFFRPLNDYRFALRRMRLRITELTVRREALEFEQKVLTDAIEATRATLAANQEAKLQLEKDLAQLEREREALTLYASNLKASLTETRTTLAGVYRSNLQLAAELRSIHGEIAASAP